MKLNIITPLIINRIENLYVIKKDIEHEIKKERFEITWFILFDAKMEIPKLDLNYKYTTLIVSDFYQSHKGNLQRNLALDMIKEGYVCFMDDDNKFHPDFFNRIYSYIKMYSNNYDFFMYEMLIGESYGDTFLPGVIKDNETIRSMYRGYRILSVSPASMRWGGVDGHQIVFKREALGNLRWNNSPSADGEFIEDLHLKYPDKFVYINEPIAYHNYLQPAPAKVNVFRRLAIKVFNFAEEKIKK